MIPLDDYRHDLLEILDVCQVLGCFGVQMPRDKEVVVQEHHAGMFVPVQQGLLFDCQPSQEVRNWVRLVESIAFCEDESVLI